MSDLVEVVAGSEGSVTVCEVHGEVDASNIDLVQARLLDSVAADAPGMVVDLTPTAYLDSAGVRVLFFLARALRSRRQELRLVVPAHGVVRRVLTLTALDELIPVDETIDDAVRLLRTGR
jgi:anti-sigma B factor antagonist